LALHVMAPDGAMGVAWAACYNAMLIDAGAAIPSAD